MPVNFDDSLNQANKPAMGASYPDHAVATNDASQRVEPLLTAEQLKNRFLWGLPLWSPITREPITEEMLKDFIVRAVNQVELLSKLQIWPVQFQQKMPFDRQLYHKWVHINVPKCPILSVQALNITTADGTTIFRMPTRWIEPSNFHKGLINVIPISPAFTAIGMSTSGVTSGAVFLTFMGQLAGIPAYWQVEWIAGFDDKSIPIVINELVGIVAAQLVLSMLASTRQVNSHGISADGLSQSVGTMGPQLYTQRMSELEVQKTTILNQIKALYGHTFFISNI